MLKSWNKITDLVFLYKLKLYLGFLCLPIKLTILSWNTDSYFEYFLP